MTDKPNRTHFTASGSVPRRARHTGFDQTSAWFAAQATTWLDDGRAAEIRARFGAGLLADKSGEGTR